VQGCVWEKWCLCQNVSILSNGPIWNIEVFLIYDLFMHTSLLFF